MNKKTWIKPTVVRFGTVEDLTAAQGQAGQNGNAFAYANGKIPGINDAINHDIGPALGS